MTSWALISKIHCRMLLVFISNNLVSPRPSEWTPGQLLIDISCHLISPRFSFAHSSCLSYPCPPPPPPPKSGPCLSPFSLLFRKMPKLIHWLLVFCVKMLGKGHQAIIFCKDNPIFLWQLRSKVTDTQVKVNSRVYFFRYCVNLNTFILTIVSIEKFLSIYLFDAPFSPRTDQDFHLK